MKNLILLMMILFISACSIYKGGNQNVESTKLMRYKPLEKFKGDTLAFVQQSILDRKQYYIGKELGVLLKDLGIPIVSFSFFPAHSNVFKVYDTALDIRSFREREKKLENNEDPIIFAIRWNPPLDAHALDSLPKRKYNGEWTPEVEAYLSKQIIGDIVKTDFKLKK
jgi:hypothetical protein